MNKQFTPEAKAAYEHDLIPGEGMPPYGTNAAAPVAVPDGWCELLKTIDIKAQAGLCQMSHAGTREFLKDIRTLVADALSAAPKAQAEPAQVSDTLRTQRWIELCEKGHGATVANEMRAMLSATPKAQAEPANGSFLGKWRTVIESIGHAEPAQAQELPALSDAARDVLAERQRQVTAEGWTPEHDDNYADGQLAYAAAAYSVASVETSDSLMVASQLFHRTRWHKEWWKPSTPRRDMVKAAALILAEIERLDRAAIRARSQS